jgi:hypothetical protein
MDLTKSEAEVMGQLENIISEWRRTESVKAP